MRTSRRSRKAPERLTYEAKEEDMDSKVEDDENLTDPSDSDYEGKGTNSTHFIDSHPRTRTHAYRRERS